MYGGGILLTASLLGGCRRLEEKIDSVSSRVDQIENTRIRTISEQLNAIESSLPKLEQTDKELEGYAGSLQDCADELGKSLSSSETRLSELEKELETIEADEALKGDALAQLRSANVRVRSLHSRMERDAEALLRIVLELEKETDALKTYKDVELPQTKDWIDATFSSLKHCNIVSENIISAEIIEESLTDATASLDRILSETLTKNVSEAFAPIASGLLSDFASEIMEEYSAAVSLAKTNLGKAWTSELSDIISATMKSVRVWVNEGLTECCTISMVEARLDAMQESIEAEISARESYLSGLLSALRRDTVEKTDANAQMIGEIEEKLSSLKKTVSENSASIENLQSDLAAAKSELTDAYTEAIASAIGSLEGRLTGELSRNVNEINTKIDEEIKAVNEAIASLTSRVKALEDETEEIRTSIEEMRSEIGDINSKIEKIMDMIQSVSYVPDYSDGRATMHYTLSDGMIVPGSATMRFEIHPASLAEGLVDVWTEALSIKAVYTITRASAGDMIELPISDVTASDGIISVTASGSGIDETYFRNDLSLNVRLLISNGVTQKASDYINMIPWTTDVIHIPDESFKSYLVKNFDANGDGEISGTEALSVTGIDVSSYNSISTLSGIEYFVNLERLDCSSNLLTALDVTHNTKLIDLNVAGNNIENIDLGSCESLERLNCAGNGFVSLNVSRNKELESLNCSGNILTDLDIRNCCLLDELDCSSNHLTAIDLSQNTKLTKLDYSNNSLASLDLAKLECCASLVSVNCANNGISEIDLHTLTQLQTLNCSRNPVRKLVLDNCAALQNLFLGDWWDEAIYGTTVSIRNYRLSETFDFSIRNTPITSFAFKDSPKLTSLVLDGDFTAVDISDNTALTTVDLSLLTGLTELDAHGCALQSLDLTKNLALRALNCSYNNLTKINVASNTVLEDFDISGNGLSAINLYSNTALKKLNVSGNKGISLVDLRNNTELTHLYVTGLGISELDLTNNAKLERIDYHENPNLISVINGGILIDGLTWALCNVGASLYPEEYGDVFNFEQAQTACPPDWRTPTKEELQSLSAHYSADTRYNRVYGRWFSGSNVYSEFAPAVFFPVFKASENFDAGFYWSSTARNSNDAYHLYFYYSSVFMRCDTSSSTFSVRCVKD